MIIANFFAGALSSGCDDGGGRLPLFNCTIGQLFREASSALVKLHCSNVRFLRFFYSSIAATDSSTCATRPNADSSPTDPTPRYCKSCQQFEDCPAPFSGALISANDMTKVLEQLGLTGDDDVDEEELGDHEADEDRAIFLCRECRANGAVLTLLESKEAEEEELREAFAVFDANRDGYITPVELWMVMRRLEFREGMMLQECRMMIQAFDQDGDGRISFDEFRSLLETAC